MYHTVMQCTVCSVLYCDAVYCVMYYTVMQCTMWCVLYCDAVYCVLYIIQWCNVLCIMYYTVMHYTVCCVLYSDAVYGRKKEMFYLTTHSTHFTVIWHQTYGKGLLR